MNLGLYIQVPFCQTKCTYCNFHTGVFSRSLFEPYVSAVCREFRDHSALHRAAGLYGNANGMTHSPSTLSADSLYLGGGTPSLLDPAALARILDAARSAFTFTPAPEITLEADPETITPEKASAWLAAGINRISLGSQSFHDLELKSAGRLHRRDDIFAANRILRAAGFANLSFDLIAGLPHQTLDSWRASLDELIALRPEHISIYLMEIDEGSRLGREVLSGGARYSAPSLPDDETMAACYDLARSLLSSSGYDHYEISNWALPALRSRHNLKYWTRAPYLGFGAGAHSFNGRERWANAHDPAAYTAAIESGRLPIEQHEVLTPSQALDEELFLGLRLLDGISIPALESRYNTSISPRLVPLVESGLLEFDGITARLAPAHLSISNEAFVELIGSSV